MKKKIGIALFVVALFNEDYKQRISIVGFSYKSNNV